MFILCKYQSALFLILGGFNMVRSNYNGKECTETRSQYYMCDCDGTNGQDCEYNTNRSLKDIFYQILETQEEIDELNGEIGELECDIITKTNHTLNIITKTWTTTFHSSKSPATKNKQ